MGVGYHHNQYLQGERDVLHHEIQSNFGAAANRQLTAKVCHLQSPTAQCSNPLFEMPT
jgi:hypothetical protein